MHAVSRPSCFPLRPFQREGAVKSIASLILITLGIAEYVFWDIDGIGNVERLLRIQMTLFKNPCLALILVYTGIYYSGKLRDVLRTEILQKMKPLLDKRVKLAGQIAAAALIAIAAYQLYSLIPSITTWILTEEERNRGYLLIVLPLAVNFLFLNTPVVLYATDENEEPRKPIPLRRK